MTNQDELQIERFTIAPALNSEQIDADIQADIEANVEKTEGDENVDEHVEL